MVGAEIERYGETVMNMHASRFSDTGGIPFPGRVVMENERGVFDIEFSDCSINTGLKESDVLFTIPPGAERLSIVDVIRAL